jgi:hypothetical protein
MCPGFAFQETALVFAANQTIELHHYNVLQVFAEIQRPFGILR